MNYECIIYKDDYIHSYNRVNEIDKKYKNKPINKIIYINNKMFYNNKKPGRIILFFNKIVYGKIINEPYLNIYFKSMSSIKKYWKENGDIKLKFNEDYTITGFLHHSRIGNDNELDEELIDHMILE
jgi:hypothetical protein